MKGIEGDDAWVWEKGGGLGSAGILSSRTDYSFL